MDNASISVNPKIADLYNKISAQDQLKVQALISLWIGELEQGGKDTLDEIMDAISDRAAERGLTPEILEELLADES
jgi:hypothetical protein